MMDSQYIWERRYKHWKRQLAAGKHRPLPLPHIDDNIRSLSVSIATIESRLPLIQKELAIATANYLNSVWLSQPWWRRIFKRPPDHELKLFSTLPLPPEVQKCEVEIQQIYEKCGPLRRELESLEQERTFLQAFETEMTRNEAQKAAIKERQALLLERQSRALIAQQQFEVQQQRINDAARSFDRHLFLIRNKDYKRGNRLDNYVRQELRDAIFTAFSFRCVACESQNELVLDHYAIPKNEGGNFILYDRVAGCLSANVATLCNSCNSAKGERSPFEILDVAKVEQIQRTHQSLLRDLSQDMKLRQILTKWYEIDVLGDIHFSTVRFNQDVR